MDFTRIERYTDPILLGVAIGLIMGFIFNIIEDSAIHDMDTVMNDALEAYVITILVAVIYMTHLYIRIWRLKGEVESKRDEIIAKGYDIFNDKGKMDIDKLKAADPIPVGIRRRINRIAIIPAMAIVTVAYVATIVWVEDAVCMDQIPYVLFFMMPFASMTVAVIMMLAIKKTLRSRFLKEHPQYAIKKEGDAE